MKISVSIDSEPVRRALQALSADASQMRPALAGIGAGVVAAAQMSFRGSRDPYGLAWLPLSRRTIAHRRKGSRQPLLDTGRLRNSITYRQVGPDTVRIGSNVVYAAIHQFGGVIHFAPRSIKVRLRQVEGGRTVFAKDKHKKGVREVWRTKAAGWSVKIPARPYLATQERGLPREYGEIIRDQLRAHFRPGALL